MPTSLPRVSFSLEIWTCSQNGTEHAFICRRKIIFLRLVSNVSPSYSISVERIVFSCFPILTQKSTKKNNQLALSRRPTRFSFLTALSAWTTKFIYDPGTTYRVVCYKPRTNQTMNNTAGSLLSWIRFSFLCLWLVRLKSISSVIIWDFGVPAGAAVGHNPSAGAGGPFYLLHCC